MLGKIALMDSAVIRALLVAFVGLLGLVLSFFGVDEAAFGANASRLIDAILLLLTAGATAYAAYARAVKPTPPLTEKAVSATADLAKKQGGFARPLVLALLLAVTVPMVAAVSSGCTGTRAAYTEAQSPDEYAFVLAEHYASLVREAANLKARPTTPPDVVAAMQKADLAAQPLVDALRPLRDAYVASKSAQDEAALQAAINSAVIAIADLVRSVKAARGSGTTMLEQRILREAERSPA